MRILIVDQCSNSKDIPEEITPLDESIIDSHSLGDLRSKDDVLSKQARKLYAGRQQQYISAATDRLRDGGDSVDRVFISAGFGVIDEDELLPAYNVTFADRSGEEIRSRARELRIQSDLEAKLTTDPPRDLIVFALGNDYYQTLDLDATMATIPEETIVLVFNRADAAKRYPNVVSVPARTEQAKEQGTITVALKGRYLQHLAEHRTHGATVENPADVVHYCTTEYTTQTGFEEYSS